MRGKILVVEHQSTIRSMVESLLKEQNFEVVSFDQGRTALDWLILSRADLIVLDNSLPEPKTLEICHRIRQNEHSKNIPILILLTLEEMRQSNQLRQAGANDFVVKPFNPRDLLEKIEVYLLEKAATGRGESIPLAQKNHVTPDSGLADIFDSEALDIDSILSESKPVSSADSLEELLRPGGEGLEISPNQPEVEQAPAFDLGPEPEKKPEESVHDYGWFLEEMQDEKKRSSQKQPPLKETGLSKGAEPETKKIKEQFEVEERGTSKIDYQKLVEQALLKEAAKKEEHQEKEVEFNPQIVIEEEDKIDLTSRPAPRPAEAPTSKHTETTKVMKMGPQVDYQSIYSELTERLAQRLAKELMDRLKPETIIQLLKEELEKVKG